MLDIYSHCISGKGLAEHHNLFWLILNQSEISKIFLQITVNFVQKFNQLRGGIEHITKCIHIQGTLPSKYLLSVQKLVLTFG